LAATADLSCSNAACKPTFISPGKLILASITASAIALLIVSTCT
jgi:hypothetical protein